jgi:hypothetical protein
VINKYEITLLFLIEKEKTTTNYNVTCMIINVLAQPFNMGETRHLTEG